MNWIAGRPTCCSGAQMTRQWSAEVEDAVYANLLFEGGVSGQVSVNWSDEATRKMTTRITIIGDGGKIVADRQELTAFLGARADLTPGYLHGWNVKNVTELTPQPAFYLRGEEYSEQLEGFLRAMTSPAGGQVCTFADAAETDFTLELIRQASQGESLVPVPRNHVAHTPARRPLFGRTLSFR